MIPIDEVVHFDVITSDPTADGAAVDADSAPIYDVFEESTDTPILDDQTMTKRTSLTGNYRGSFTASAANGFEAGKWYSVNVTAVVGGTTGKCVAKSFRVAPAETSAGVPQVRVSAIADGIIAAATFASGALDAVWSTTTRLLTAGTNIVLAKGTGVTGFNDLSAAQVNAEADTALADAGVTTTRTGYLDNLSAGAVATAAKLLSYFQSALRKDVTVDADIGGNYDDATDSQEAIRDRGDAAWTTATGFSTLDAAGVRGAVGLASANLDTQLAALPTAAADAVWEEAIADHSGTAGSTAEQLSAAGSAGDPWATALPGSYTSGQAGKIVGDNLNATVGSRASQTSVDDLPTNAELATALAGADDAVLAAIAALNNLSQANIRTAIGLASANLDTQLGDLPTNAELATGFAGADDAVLAAIAALNNLSAAQVTTALNTYDGPTKAELDAAVATLATAATLALVKAKTDSLTFTQAGHVDSNVQRINDVAVDGAGTSGSPWRPAA